MILAILQARMSSSRLPGKVMRLIQGRPMVAHQMERLQRSRRIDRLVLATSREPSDDPLAALCQREGWLCYRGDLNDVLARFKGAADAYGPADHIVRLTADCPLIDPVIVDQTIDFHLTQGADYTSNCVEGHRTFPDGLDTEVMTRVALERAALEGAPGPDREHVTPYLYHNPGVFKIAAFTQSRELGTLRWTVDTAADFEFADAVFGALLPDKPDFGQDDVLALLGTRPELARINAS
jgi:spore coat polysaccharide biosynthesis protein SpsF